MRHLIPLAVLWAAHVSLLTAPVLARNPGGAGGAAATAARSRGPGISRPSSFGVGVTPAIPSTRPSGHVNIPNVTLNNGGHHRGNGSTGGNGGISLGVGGGSLQLGIGGNRVVVGERPIRPTVVVPINPALVPAVRPVLPARPPVVKPPFVIRSVVKPPLVIPPLVIPPLVIPPLVIPPLVIPSVVAPSVVTPSVATRQVTTSRDGSNGGQNSFPIFRPSPCPLPQGEGTTEEAISATVVFLNLLGSFLSLPPAGSGC